MKKYTVRDKHGVLLAIIGGRTVDLILRDASGFWRDYKTEKTGNVKCFEFTEGGCFSLTPPHDRSHFEMMLWEGTLFIDDNC